MRKHSRALRLLLHTPIIKKNQLKKEMRDLKLAVEAIGVSKQLLYFFNELVNMSTALKARNN